MLQVMELEKMNVRSIEMFLYNIKFCGGYENMRTKKWPVHSFEPGHLTNSHTYRHILSLSLSLSFLYIYTDRDTVD